MSGCEKLETLECCNNRVSMTKLDASGCTALSSLSCYRNQLTSLDVSSCAELTALRCNNNQLTSLDVTQNEVLWGLDCSNNALTALDVSQNTVLENLSCSGQSVRLEVVRGADETWSADLAALVAGWKEHFETIYSEPGGSLGPTDRHRRLEQGNGAARRRLRL